MGYTNTMTEQHSEHLPRHVGIIMDGNGRWAAKRGFTRNMGHKRGADVFGKIARHAQKVGVEYLTVYAFSTENWKRPPDEVAGIMDLLRSYLSDADRYTKDNMRVRILGDRAALDDDINRRIADMERRSSGHTGMTLNIALNYGGRDEILRAAHTLARQYLTGDLKSLDSADQEYFAGLLYTAGQPEVDLVIRTSGETRISNFLLWQSAYAEYVFTDVLWPDFSPRHFDAAIDEYARRSRRMGGI